MAEPQGRVRVGVLISGTGSNMVALIDAASHAESAYSVVLVASNNPAAAGLTSAAASGVQAVAVDHRPFGKDRVAHEAVIQSELERCQVEVVVLAGYMRLLTPWFVGRWAGRMINIHPSLLPLYPGLDTHARAIAAGDAEAGCTVHLVTDGVDEGPVLAQARVPILPDDTAASLSQRVLRAEHRLYPETLNAFCAGLR